MIDPRNPTSVNVFSLKIATPTHMAPFFEEMQRYRCKFPYADGAPEDVVGGEQWRTFGSGQTLSDSCPLFCSGVEATGLYGKNPTLDANNATIFTGNSYCEQNLGGTVHAHGRADEFYYYNSTLGAGDF